MIRRALEILGLIIHCAPIGARVVVWEGAIFQCDGTVEAKTENATKVNGRWWHKRLYQLEEVKL